MNKSRLEAFTDAVIAIAATIMVLELHPPKSESLQGLFSEWPVILSYVISFAMIYIVWFSHHNMFNKAKVISTKTFMFNGVWLFSLTLVPFATTWVGNHPDGTIPEVVYLSILLIWSFSFQLMDEQVLRDNSNIKRDVSNNLISRLFLYGGYVLGIIIAFFWPIASLFLVGIITIVLSIQLTSIKPTPPNK